MEMNDAMRKLFDPCLESLYQHCDGVLAACPFMPYVGEDYESASVRVLAIGKATNGWDDEGSGISALSDAARLGASYDRLSAVTKEFIMTRVLPFYGGEPGYSSAFWRVLYRSLGAALDKRTDYVRDLDLSTRRFKALAWTNVFKLGAPHGNPSRGLIEVNRQFLDTVKSELEILKPHIVLCPTGPGYDAYLGSAIGSIIENRQEPYLFVHRGALFIRTRHYQGMKSCAEEQLLETIRVATQNK